MNASVIIATRDRPSELTHCLRALAGQDTTRQFEVIVVDDGSSPRLRSGDVAAACPRGRVVWTTGVGPARARNRGIEAATAPVILFTDDDTEPAPHWIETACRHLDKHRDHIGVEGPTVSPPFDALYERSLENCRPGAYWTCNIAYRRDALTRIGGFAEVFPSAHAEDLDLAFRALPLGPIGFADDMVVTHYPTSMTFGDTVRRTRNVSSDVVLYQRHPERFASRVPVRLLPLVGHLRYLRGRLRSERNAMIGTPRRLARFSGGAACSLAVAIWAPLLQSRGDRIRDAQRDVGPHARHDAEMAA